jgi:DNA-binding CsgD family transcriptional regulator
LGDARRAAVLYQALLPYAQRNIVVGTTVACFGAASRYLGILATTMRHWEEAQRHFAEAMAMNARLAAKPWLAHTQQRYAEMLSARDQPGDREHAKTLLNEALALSGELGMSGVKRSVLALLERLSSQSAQAHIYPGGLTPREVEVLRLIAVGKSNRDIAEALCISLYTVASHVRNILTKINAANRTEAAAFAARHGFMALPPLPSDSGNP